MRIGLLLLLVGACGADPLPELPEGLESLTLAADGDTTVINAGWRVCETADDCRSVSAVCSQCCVYHAINTDFADDYGSEYNRVCEEYEGGVCDCEDPSYSIECVSNVCTIVE